MGKKRTRRENGAGTVELLNDGRWRVRLTVETSAGRKRKAFTAKTKKAVVAKRDAYLRDREGIAFDAEMVTVSDYLDRWLEDSVKQTRRPSTVVEYESVCRVHLKPALGSLKLQKLGPVHIQGLLAEKRREGYAEGTCRRIYAILGAAMTQALKWRLVASSPLASVDAPSVPQRTSRMALTVQEVARLFDAAKVWREGRLYPILLLAVSTGMRQGEILGLLWEDIEGEAITVRRTLHRDTKTVEKGSARYGPPKGGKARRVEMDARVTGVLKDHRKRQLAERMASEAWETEHVFATPEGKPIHRAVLLQSFKRLCKREGLPPVTFHELRHTCATLAAKRNVHPNTVKELLGHADVSTTLRVYSHEWPGAARDASVALADVLF
jgi:integrase